MVSPGYFLWRKFLKAEKPETFTAPKQIRGGESISYVLRVKIDHVLPGGGVCSYLRTGKSVLGLGHLLGRANTLLLVPPPPPLNPLTSLPMYCLLEFVRCV
jgi:hypothetical protein